VNTMFAHKLIAEMIYQRGNVLNTRFEVLTTFSRFETLL